MKRVLAVASGGGHWVQLLSLRAAFDDLDVAWVTVEDSYREQVSGARFYTVTDATRWDKLKLMKMTAELAYIMLRERPDVVISTGAAPGGVALCFGKMLGARTIWVDSIANVESLSMSGRKVKRFADVWLTQWEHLAAAGGPEYKGSLL